MTYSYVEFVTCQYDKSKGTKKAPTPYAPLILCVRADMEKPRTRERAREKEREGNPH